MYGYRYLIEGPKGAVLHTGDVRAEPKLIESLRNHPALSAYITPNDGDANQLKILEAIYLDTSCVLANHEIPTKVSRPSSVLVAH
jgi:DNA cross-link repair 1C protein